MESNESILKELVFIFIRRMVKPFSPETIGCEFKFQNMSTGKSPRATMHKIPAMSPVLAGSSPNPKSNGVICGETKRNFFSP